MTPDQMTPDPDLSRAVRSWLVDGADRLPERVLDAVLDAVPSTPQRRPLWSPRRLTDMTSRAQIIALAAAVILVAFVGIRLLPAPGGVGTPAATPTPAPTIAPSPDAAIDNLIDLGRRLTAGSYRVGGPFLAPYTVTLPDGYQVKAIEAGEASFSSNAGFVGALVPEGVFADPCKPDLPVKASTVDEFVTALSSMTGFSAEDVRQTTVGGRPATTFLLKNGIDTSTAGCTRGPLLPMFSFAGHPEGASTNGGMDELFYVVDVDGKPVFVVVDGWSSPTALDELKSIAEGIQFK